MPSWNKEIRNNRTERGVVLLTTLFLMVVFTAFLAIYNGVTRESIVNTKSSKDSVVGFYAAEAGLNLRAEEIRLKFVGFGNSPAGLGPILDGSELPCTGSNIGTPDESGANDLGCQQLSFAEREVTTYVVKNPVDSYNIEIPIGERYQGLNAVEDRFIAFSTARDSQGNTEAILELTFRNRSVPLFQFAVFYDFDLEFYPGPPMTMNGPVHANGNIFLSSHNSLTIEGQVTSTDQILMARKPGAGGCGGGDVFVWDQAGTPQELDNCSGALTQQSIEPFNGMIEFGVDRVDVPTPDLFSPEPGRQYWDLADLRVVLNLDDTTGRPDKTHSDTGIEVRDTAGNVMVDLTNALESCPGKIQSYFVFSRDNDPHLDDDPRDMTLPTNRAVGVTNTFYDRRELLEGGAVNATRIPQTLLEVDMAALLNCIANLSDSDGDDVADPSGIYLLGENAYGVQKHLDDDTDGGLVLFFTVEGPRSNDPQSFYGVRVRNGKVLQAVDEPWAPRVQGLTIVTDQPFYVMGDYNSPIPDTDRLPAAFLSDTFNVISNSWCATVPYNPGDPNYVAANDEWVQVASWDDNPGHPRCDLKSLENQNRRRATLETFVNAAVLSGSDLTANGRESGGVHNYPRFHEDWSGTRFYYRGSLISLNQPQHANGRFRCCNNDQPYSPPNRDWGFDENFKNYDLLPPATPNFSYLKQQLFERTFERQVATIEPEAEDTP